MGVLGVPFGRFGEGVLGVLGAWGSWGFGARLVGCGCLVAVGGFGGWRLNR